MFKNGLFKIYLIIGSIFILSTLLFTDFVLTFYTILIFGLGLIIIFRIYFQIRKIDNDMNNILNGDYQINIKDYDEGVISNLRNNIYKITVKLREQNEQLLKNQKYIEEVLEDISHQIKTPSF